jgi:hypothetical protein
MHQFTLSQWLKLAYPYWIISRVITLLLGSLIFLILHESIRRLRLSKLAIGNAGGKLGYVNRIG